MNAAGASEDTDDLPVEVVGFCPSPRDDLWLVEVQIYQILVTDSDRLEGVDPLSEWLAGLSTFRLGVDFLTWPLLGWIHTRTTRDGKVSDHLRPACLYDLEDGDDSDIQTTIWARGTPFDTVLRKASPRVNLSQRDRRVAMHADSEPVAATMGAALRALAPRDAVAPFDDECVKSCGWHELMRTPEFVHLPECLHRQWVGAGLDPERSSRLCRPLSTTAVSAFRATDWPVRHQ